MRALRDVGVERINAANPVCGVNCDFKPVDIVIPHDFSDFAQFDPITFFDEAH